MRVKFLHTTPSDSPEAPFQAGQIIDIPISKQVRTWIQEGSAVALDEPREEAAVLERPRARGSR
jgi:hypothetical protein